MKCVRCAYELPKVKARHIVCPKCRTNNWQPPKPEPLWRHLVRRLRKKDDE